MFGRRLITRRELSVYLKNRKLTRQTLKDQGVSKKQRRKRMNSSEGSLIPPTNFFEK